MAKQYILGIDGGGSKTEAAIINEEGNVLGTGLGGGTNTNFTSRRSAVTAFKRAIRGALSQAGLRPEDVTCAATTFAMVAHQAFTEIGLPVKPNILGEPQVVFERAGFHEMYGIALVAGTGSSCFGYARDGRESHAGGWGAILGDEGSAFDIGLRGIKRAMMARAGRMPPTLLADELEAYTGPGRAREVVARFGTRINQSGVAGFAAHVSRAAEAGDEAAIAILEEAGEDLGELATFVARRLFAEEDEFPVVLGGGVFKAGKLVIDPIRLMFRPQFPRARVIVAEGSPGEAVARIARREFLGRRDHC